MRASLLLGFLAIGCVETYPPAEFNRIDRSHQTWSYCGAEEFRQDVRDAVRWWGDRGLSFGPEVACGERSDIEIRDQTGVADDGYGAAWPDIGLVKLYRYFWLEPKTRATTLRHELGHLLGFEHGGTPDCLMYPMIDMSSGTLCQDEVAAISR